MGYEVVFIPTEEKMKEYKPWNELEAKKNIETESQINMAKREIVSFCLKDHSKDATTSIARSLQYSLLFLARVVKEQEKHSVYFQWKEDERHEVYFCSTGYDYKEDDLIERYIDELTVLAGVVETPDYFENKERFFDKWNEIKDLLCDFVESITDICIHDITNDLKPFEDKASDEEDPFLTEKQETYSIPDTQIPSVTYTLTHPEDQQGNDFTVEK